jgi:hypothetical protein
MKIEIPDSLFQRLQKHAVPLEDTTASVIERLVDHLEAKPNGLVKGKQSEVGFPDHVIKKFNPIRPPDLFHTRSRGTLDSSTFSNWNDLVRVAHIAAFAKAKTFEVLKTVTQAQIRKGSHSDSGYHFLPEIGISIQGVDANHAWMYSLRLAQYLKVPLQALVEWRNNEKAAHPGMSGVLEWNP